MRTTTSCPYGDRTSGSAAIASAAATGTSQPPASRRPMSGSAPTSALTSAPSSRSSLPAPSEATLHQPFRPPDEDDRHQHVDADAAPLGEEDLAEGVDEADQQRRDQGAGDRADAADDDDDETDDEHARSHAGVDRRERRRDHAGERRERDAAGEDDAIQAPDVDTEAAHHVAVARAGADHHAEPRAVDDGVERERDDQARRRREDAIPRVLHQAAEMEAAGQPFRRRDAVHVVAESEAAQLLEDEDQRVGEQHLLQVVALVEEA